MGAPANPFFALPSLLAACRQLVLPHRPDSPILVHKIEVSEFASNSYVHLWSIHQLELILDALKINTTFEGKFGTHD